MPSGANILMARVTPPHNGAGGFPITMVALDNLFPCLLQGGPMRKWQRDLADHLVLLMMTQLDESPENALVELKRQFPNLPIEQAARSAHRDAMPARERHA